MKLRAFAAFSLFAVCSLVIVGKSSIIASAESSAAKQPPLPTVPIPQPVTGLLLEPSRSEGLVPASANLPLPVEEPKTVTLKVDPSSGKRRIETATAVCAAAFEGYKSAQPTAAIGTTAGEMVGWLPGKAAILVPKYAESRQSNEPVALCFLDGQFDRPPGSERSRALWVVGIDGMPVLYSVGGLSELLPTNPSTKQSAEPYPSVARVAPPASPSTTAFPPSERAPDASPVTISREDSLGITPPVVKGQKGE